MIAYKVFNIKQGHPYFLYHGLNGSRRVTIGNWIKAERKLVKDGSASIKYWSGFHLFASIRDVQNWLKLVTHIDSRCVVQVDIKDIKPKTCNRNGVILAQQIRIRNTEWTKRKPLSSFCKEN